ncbi:MAG: SCO family protein [Planctomycetota bacterium]
MSRLLTFWLAILFVFGGAMVIVLAKRGQGDDYSTAVSAKPAKQYSLENGFQLKDQTGSEFDSNSLDGKIWIGSIFFAQCPSTCRIQNMRVAELQKRYGEHGVEFVSVTCDPKNDTVTALKDYSKTFEAESDKWHFLTGDLDLIKQIGGEKFNIAVDDKVHSDRLVLFGRDGELINSYRSLEAQQFAELKDKLDELLGLVSTDGDTTTEEAKAEQESESSESQVTEEEVMTK